jgi:hypothetical protein
VRHQGKYTETSSKCAELDVFVRALLQAGSATVNGRTSWEVLRGGGG